LILKVLASYWRLLTQTKRRGGGFEPPKGCDTLNGLANRKRKATTSKSQKHLGHGTPALSVLGQCASQNDPDLAFVIARWSDLPSAVRAGILAMVKASR